MSTTVVHCKRQKYDVYIGRPSKWGNPLEIGDGLTREDVIKGYELYLEEHPELVAAAKRELRGKILGCWCKPKVCHGDVLARIADEP